MNVVRGRAWKLLYAIMLIAVTGGCFAGTRPPSTTSGEGIIEIEVDWDVITAAGTDVTPLAVAPMALPANVTHVGARIEYPGQNAGFFQSVSREVASEQGIITMKVPPSKNANLYVAAVDSSTLSVVKLGYKRGLVILEDAVTTVKTDEITWVSPGWRIVGEDSLVEGDANTPFRTEVTADKSKRWEPLLEIEVTDPFHINERKSYDELLIGLNGYGSVAEENPNGWRRMEIHRCPEDDRPCKFAPRLTAPAFGIPLPEPWSVYTIYPEGEITVHWQ